MVRRSFSVAFAIAGITACGAAGPSTSSGGESAAPRTLPSALVTVDPCSLLTTDQVQAGLGSAAPGPVTARGVHKCTWSSGFNKVAVTLVDEGSFALDHSAQTQASPVSGVGTEAYNLPVADITDSGMPALLVRSGHAGFLIEVVDGSGDPASVMPKERALANAVIAKLPAT